MISIQTSLWFSHPRAKAILLVTSLVIGFCTHFAAISLWCGWTITHVLFIMEQVALRLVCEWSHCNDVYDNMKEYISHITCHLEEVMREYVSSSHETGASFRKNFISNGVRVRGARSALILKNFCSNIA